MPGELLKTKDVPLTVAMLEQLRQSVRYVGKNAVEALEVAKEGRAAYNLARRTFLLEKLSKTGVRWCSRGQHLAYIKPNHSRLSLLLVRNTGDEGTDSLGTVHTCCENCKELVYGEMLYYADGADIGLKFVLEDSGILYDLSGAVIEESASENRYPRGYDVPDKALEKAVKKLQIIPKPL